MRILVFLLAVIYLANPTMAQEPWRDYLQARTEKLEKQSREAIEAVKPSEWPELQRLWREQLQEMLGLAPWPERTNLAVQTTGEFTREDYQVTNLAYQSRPGLYVTANLYRPTTPPPESGWPAVLYVCGHANVRDESRLLGNKTGYHHHGVWFARQGVVCLIIDTVQLGEMHGEHHGTYKLGRWDWITRGYTPAGVEAWNAIRAIDYLETLPQVNKSKIGITGRSGGGAYSWFAAALDPRIAAAVPVAGITDLRNHVIDNCVEGHCDCMYFVNYHGWDYNRLAALIAPRPLMLANSDHDTIFPLDGVMRVHNAVAGLYARLGAANKFGLLLTPGPHQDTQELQVGAFRWLLTHLTDQPVVVDRAATKELEPTQLQVFPQETPADQHVSDLSDWFVPAATDVLDATQAAERWRDEWSAIVAASLERYRPLNQNDSSSNPPVEYRREVEAESNQIHYRWYKQLLSDGNSWGSQILMLQSGDAPNKFAASESVVVHLGPLLRTSLDQATLTRQLNNGGWLQRLVASDRNAIHVVLLPRSQQMWAAELALRQRIHLERRFYLLGESSELLALADVVDQLQWLTKLSESNSADDTKLTAPDRWQVVGTGRASPLAALAVLHARKTIPSLEGLKQLTVIDFPRDWRLAPELPGLARHMSLDNLLAAAGSLLTLQEQSSRSPSDIAEGYDTQHQLLIDSSNSPQQATGLRLVEPTANSITVWCRATRWMLPNLGDQPEVQFADDPSVAVRERREPILPADGTAGLRYAAPGVPAQIRVRYRTSGKGYWKETEWQDVGPETDYSHLFELHGLEANTEYELQSQVRAPQSQEVSSTQTASFRTLPSADASQNFRLAIGTCQEFDDRDGEHGMDLYRTLLHRKADAFILAGDVVYYDKLARSLPLANYHWQRTYSLPTHVNFHRRVPTFFLKDDHDTYVNDSWPGQYLKWTRQFSFEDGQRIFRQQTGVPETPYRTVHLGKHMQLWLMEGRDYRDPNSREDAEDKTIWGPEQSQWLEDSLKQSTATFKVIVSPTPIVGPDRDNKGDNHANKAFATEGKRVRKLLSSYKNLVVVCGDRHWQYHSRDPETGLHEFSVGPVTNRHAGGWPKDDFRKEIHQFLRVGGGYLELELDCESSSPQLNLTHRDPYGTEQHRHTLSVE